MRSRPDATPAARAASSPGTPTTGAGRPPGRTVDDQRRAPRPPVGARTRTAGGVGAQPARHPAAPREDDPDDVGQVTDSFDGLLEELLPGLLRYATAPTGDADSAGDLVQEVLLRAHTRRGRIGALDRPDLYLRRMVTNEHISWRRRWHVRSTSPTSDEVIAEHAPARPDAAGQLADRDDPAEVQTRVHAALRGRRHRRPVAAVGQVLAVGASAAAVAGLAAGGAAVLRTHHDGSGAPASAASATAPASSPGPPAGPTATAAATPPATTTTEAFSFDVFTARGHTYEDAVQLAALWSSDALTAEVRGGRELLAGTALPVRASRAPLSPTSQEGQQVAGAAFYDAGYGLEQAQQLAALWHLGDVGDVGDVGDAKVAGGQELLEGQTLPVAP